MEQLQTRELQIRKVNLEERTITGLAVPYNQTANIAGVFNERFERGAIDSVEGVRLFYGHNTDIPIGSITRGTDTEDGYEITAKISETSRGNDVYNLMKDGVLDRFSISFMPVEHREDENGTVVRTKVRLFEVSVVPFPAYEGAQVSQVRSEQNTADETNERASNDALNTMTDVTNYDDSEIRSELEIVKRELAVVRENGAVTGATGSQFRSGGEFLQALAANDESARNELRAANSTLANSHTSNDWKNDALVVVNKGRALVNAFSSGPLGNKGNYVEYPKVSGTSGVVAVQANEGDALGLFNLSVTTATAQVKTYGVYSDLSRQVIERSDVSYLDAVLRGQLAEYAKTTNGVVRSALTGASAQAGVSFTLSSATAANFINAVSDGVQKIEDNGVLAPSADFIIVSTDVWQKIANTTDSAGRPVFALNGDGSNTAGTANIKNLTMSIVGVPVLRDPLLAAKSFYVASSDAICTWENAGAPLRLDDENIIMLTKQFAIYGYMAAGVKDANGLVKATIA